MRRHVRRARARDLAVRDVLRDGPGSCTVAGIAIGSLAGGLAHAPRLGRWLVLASAALFVVVMLAWSAKLLDFALVSAIPTLAAVTALERWTRAASALPVASAR